MTAKLFFTGILQFIEPDTNAQVFAGLSIAFAYMVRVATAAAEQQASCRRCCTAASVPIPALASVPTETEGDRRPPDESIFRQCALPARFPNSGHVARASPPPPQILFLVKRPYADKGVRQVGFVASLLLFLFLFFGLLIKGDVSISRHSDTFYAVFVGIIAVATFAVPPSIVVWRWYHADIVKADTWKREISGGGKLNDDVDAEDEDPVTAGRYSTITPHHDAPAAAAAGDPAAAAAAAEGPESIAIGDEPTATDSSDVVVETDADEKKEKATPEKAAAEKKEPAPEAEKPGKEA